MLEEGGGGKASLGCRQILDLPLILCLNWGGGGGLSYGAANFGRGKGGRLAEGAARY
jgi:hypothetical protein